ncbi:aryl-alcohol dehydrogenase-like predicted oxidoreductase [Natranaerovirga pectinivora]|uniref:Aryl-alcohol dehydrogenase-like predicted oxidoreductase n=1 Tax=Natranaerovirga pectinivora TaxID=682400 RepID=A0A4R3MKX4_9FIRM|nr:aldo/keto reductase [Natranaerovirga pectinivora]TCT15312.1 aryl-alcohol dehydrogenase-like predicted oxidoreductase [Natranaerovirga pectinivora]
MNFRTLGKTGYEISEVSFGSWAIGGTWGEVDDKTSLMALDEAIDQGVNFFDTADVYGDGRSERLLSKLSASVKDRIYIATKAGRRLNPHNAEGYNKENLSNFINRSLKNLNVECIDLLQLHCPPTDVFYNEEVFSALDDLKKEGKIAHYGVSVEKVSEALKALEYPNVATVQIIYNMFRHKPGDEFFQLAKNNNVGIICRVPLASGLLTGKMTKDFFFDPKDHRSFNRNGESFDKGETFSGVDYELGLKAVEELRKIKPQNMTMAQFALKWILMNDHISCIIPGGKTPEQVKDNVISSELPNLTEEVMDQVKNIYDKYIREGVHKLW